MQILKNKTLLSILLTFLSISSSITKAQTNVNGGIYSNTTWTLAKSPYILNGSIVVFPGKTLTIEPGVEVRVKYNTFQNTNDFHYIEIRGSLVAVGTLNKPIIFQGDTLQKEFTWMGINVKATQGGNIIMDYFEMNNSYFGIYADKQGAPSWDIHHCKFNYNNYAIQPFGPINFYDCSFKNNSQAIGSGWQVNHNILVKRCEFLNNYSCNGFQSSLSVDSCVVSENINGIFYATGPVSNTLFERNKFSIYGVNGQVTNCIFSQNSNGLVEFSGSADNCSFYANGLAAEVSSGGIVKNSTFTDDTIAIAYSSALNSNSKNPIISQNKICGSVNYYVKNNSDVNFEINQNCFCEEDSSIIEGLIYDGYDDFTRGLFNYTIYDSTCQNVLNSVSKVMLTTSIKKSTIGAFGLYPVPAGEQLFMTIPENMVDKKLIATLLDVQSRKIGESLQLNSTKLTWNLSNIPSGIYFIKVSGINSAMLKFVK